MLLRSRTKRPCSAKKTKDKKMGSTSINLMKPKARKKSAKCATALEQPSMELFLSPRSKPRHSSMPEGNKHRETGLTNISSPAQTALFLTDELDA